MRVDKKSRGDRLRFVVLEALARPAILEAPDPALLTAAYAEIAARAHRTRIGSHREHACPGPQRAEPRSARAAGARGLRRRPRTTTWWRRADAGVSELGLDVEVRQTDDEAELVGWLHEAADAGRRRAQPGGVHALLLRAAGRLRPARRTARRGAHLSNPAGREEFRHTSVIAPRRHGHDRRLRRRLLPAGAAGRRHLGRCLRPGFGRSSSRRADRSSSRRR